MNLINSLLLSILSASLISSCGQLDSFIFSAQTLSAYSFVTNQDKPNSTFLNIPQQMIEEVSFKSDDGSTNLAGVWIKNDGSDSAVSANNRTIFYCHGNYHHLNYYQDRLAYLYRLGYNVFAFDYRGFGKSAGQSKTAKGLKEDGLGAFKYFVSQNGKFPNSADIYSNELILYGFSLGNYPCLQILNSSLADPFKRIASVSEAAFAGAQNLVTSSVGLPVPGSLILDSDFSNMHGIKAAALKHVPALFLHGQKDEFVRYENSLDLFRTHTFTTTNAPTADGVLASVANLTSCEVNSPIKKELSSTSLYAQWSRTLGSCGSSNSRAGIVSARAGQVFSQLITVNEAGHSTVPETLGILPDDGIVDNYGSILKTFLDDALELSRL